MIELLYILKKKKDKKVNLIKKYFLTKREFNDNLKFLTQFEQNSQFDVMDSVFEILEYWTLGKEYLKDVTKLIVIAINLSPMTWKSVKAIFANTNIYETYNFKISLAIITTLKIHGFTDEDIINSWRYIKVDNDTYRNVYHNLKSIGGIQL